jgi:hypothetical protein
MSLGCGSIPGESALGRQGFCVRGCFTPPGNELAAVIRAAIPPIARRTDDEQISQTGRQTEKSVLMRTVVSA